MKISFKSLIGLMLVYLVICGNFVLGYNEEVYGSGRVKIETRTVAPFSGIEIQGVGDVYLTQGSPAQIIVISDDNLLPLVKTKVEHDRLTLNFKQGVSVKKLTKLEFQITLPKLNEVTITGAGNVYSKTKMDTQQLLLLLNGTGKIELALNVDQVTETLNGAGSIRVKGKARQQTMLLHGMGQIDGKGLISKEAEVNLTGVGDCTVVATATLSLAITGVGSIYYGGGGRLIQSNVSGVGKIRPF
jgi:hypothetical protein